MFFGILTTLLDAAGYSSTESASASVDTPSLTVMERRAISIPFGISSPLTITADGGQVFVTGHGVCWDDGQLFDVHVRVAQSSTLAFAEGRSIDVCANGDRQIWDATASAMDQTRFEAGPARACAEAVEFASQGIADEHRWCKDIELTEATQY